MIVSRAKLPAREFLLSILAIVVATGNLHAVSMTVEPRTAGIDESITITIALDGDLARLDSIDLPLENLVVESGPSVSSQFEWVNGVTTRQKIFRWTVFGEKEGAASVGPIPLESRGTAAVIPRNNIRILPDPLAGASTADDVVRRLRAAGRDMIFIFPEVDRAEAFVGEQVVVTWYLYTAESVRDLDISSTPALREFWTEEIPLGDEPTRSVTVGGIDMQRLPIRRVALFPLHSGRISTGTLVAVAEIMRPIQDRFGVFSRIERRVGRVVLRSQAPELVVQPLPAGTASAAVGRFTMKCTLPAVPAEGPVSFDVTVEGEGNLRSAPQPRFTVPPQARTEVQDRGVTVDRARGRVTMSRTWQFIMFPRRSGPLEIPAVVFEVWDPERRGGTRLECAGAQVIARATGSIELDQSEDQVESEPAALRIRPFAIAAGLLLTIGLVLFLVRRRRSSVSPRCASLLKHAEDPAALRVALHETLAELGITPDGLFRDPSELGETFRSLQSMLDILERETLTADRSPDELRRRTSEFVRELDRADSERARTSAS